MLTASMRRSPTSWAASPPPKPSPIEGEGFCPAARREDETRARGRCPALGRDAAAGAVARADAILHPRGLAARRAQAQGVARALHRRCPLLHAAPQER